MNGRIYDPGIGRFLTPDTIVQFTALTDSFNRYSYALNNPLRFTDPSGHEVVTLVVSAIWSYAGTEAIGTYFVEYLISMFFAGTVDAMMAGADFDQALKAGAFTAASAAVAYGVNSSKFGFGDNAWKSQGWSWNSTQHEVSRALTHGITQGAISEVGGGEFGSTFLSAFSGSVSGNFGNALDFSPGDALIYSMVVGGTTSEIGGGKFSNGAITSAFTFTLMSKRIKSINDFSKMGSDLVDWLYVDVESAVRGFFVEKPISIYRGLNKIWKSNSSIWFKVAMTPTKIIQNTVIPTQGWLGSNVGYDQLSAAEKTLNPSIFVSPDKATTQNASIYHDFSSAPGSSIGPWRHWQWVVDSWTGPGVTPGPFGQVYRILGTPSFTLFSWMESIFKS